MNRECNKCVYSTRDGGCRKFECKGTVTVEQIRTEAYQQGRADKYQEITSEYMLLTEKQVADIRDDVIDELKPFVHKNVKGNIFIFIEDYNVNKLSFAEQLKEHKE